MKITDFLSPNPPKGRFDRIVVRELGNGWQMKVMSKNNKVIVDGGTMYNTERLVCEAIQWLQRRGLDLPVILQ